MDPTGIHLPQVDASLLFGRRRALAERVGAFDINHHAAVGIGLAGVSASALDTFSFSGSTHKLPLACGALRFAIFIDIFTIGLNEDLVPVGQRSHYIPISLS